MISGIPATRYCTLSYLLCCCTLYFVYSQYLVLVVVACIVATFPISILVRYTVNVHPIAYSSIGIGFLFLLLVLVLQVQTYHAGADTCAVHSTCTLYDVHAYGIIY